MATLIVGFLLGPLPAGAEPRPDPVLESPIEPFRALRLFDRPDTPWGAGHRGIDIEADVGGVVLSPGDGVVIFAGFVVDRGVVSIGHAGGLASSLEPVAATVVVGDRVSAGDPIGTVTDEKGHSGTETCLHWGVRRNGRYINPLDVLSGFGPVRLLPLVDGA
ncbi:MAG: M23 family metallopeptidase [Demequinaceae bacterium]|nr:M23 family metallopeptidase [Demequinaceae bacterium]